MLLKNLVPLAAVGGALAAQFEVIVGGPGVLQFNPPTVNASVGDVVLFTFKQSNHTVTQSTFESPCEMSSDGFDSGFIPVSDGVTSGFPQAQFTVEDMNPVWAYCRQGNHCQQGMVFAINPGDKFPAFQAAAMGQTISSSSSAAPPPPSSAPPATSSPPPPPTTSAALPVSSASQASTPPQSASSPSPSPSTLSPSPLGPRDHFVIVGGPGKILFEPSNITAAPGDTVTFQFQQKNHTVTQSSFLQPCVSLTETSTSGQTGFDSGFIPVSDSATNFPTFKVNITDTAPIWAFCRQTNHCGMGMVFSVNADESGPNNFAAFQARAKSLNGSSSNTTDKPTGSANTARRLTNTHSAGVIVALVSLVLAVVA